MIRIDEIYKSIFWAYLQTQPKPTRLFYFDPFGRTDPESLYCFHNGHNNEHNYIVLFDQEPLDFEMHFPSFQAVQTRCQNLYPDWPCRLPSYLDTNPVLITSELRNRDTLKICEHYGYKHLHYFFHGWAALDWFRGYNRTFLITPMNKRKPTRTFLMPNRIIGGKRLHRVEMMYHILKNKLLNNHLSFPAVCPVEQQPIASIANSLLSVHPDIVNMFNEANLPINFAEESGHPMHSYQLSLFDECADSLLYLVSETVATGARTYLTEKSLKPICLQMPFILVAGAGSLEYLRSYGFKTFADFWDESYDREIDDHIRIKKIADVLTKLDSLTVTQRQAMYSNMYDVIIHNYNHFYSGDFEQILWHELKGVLDVL